MELPDLPSVFAPIALREGGDAMARAVALAPERGAGLLAWVRSAARAEAAVVLEPEMPLAEARLALLAAANALADALVVLGPPEAVIALRWPAEVLVNGGRVGGLRLALPPGASESEVPDWLVVGFELALAPPPGIEPGDAPDRTCLEEEGFEEPSAAELSAAWARHLMAGLDRWQSKGPRRLVEDCLARLEDGRADAGLRRGIDPKSGALVLERDGNRQLVPLA
jgi:biotin-(acetyl-CoA carboxylase) ligase